MVATNYIKTTDFTCLVATNYTKTTAFTCLVAADHTKTTDFTHLVATNYTKTTVFTHLVTTNYTKTTDFNHLVVTNYTKSLFMNCHFPEKYLPENQRSRYARTKWHLSNDLLYVCPVNVTTYGNVTIAYYYGVINYKLGPGTKSTHIV